MQRVSSSARIALSSRKQGRQQAKTCGLQPKKLKGDVSRVGLKTVELNGCKCDIAKPEAVIVAREKERAKREAIVAAMGEGERKRCFGSKMLGRLKGILAACVSLLEVAKSALADVVVLEPEARTANDQIFAEVKRKIPERTPQYLDEAQADGELQEFKPNNDS